MGAFYFSKMKLNHIHNEICKDIYCKYSDLHDSKKEILGINNPIGDCAICESKISGKKTFSDSIFIFDWDDTLMCTSFLTPLGTFAETEVKFDKDQMESIKILDDSVFRLLFSTMVLGDTYVVTNASKSWVNYSAEKFYPKVNSLLTKIEILSARDSYEESFPMNNKQWKISTFLDIKSKYHTASNVNIICIGDSHIEMQAANALAAEFNISYLKTIKFRESPKIEELIKQINLITKNLKNIYEEKKNLSITVEKKKKS